MQIPKNYYRSIDLFLLSFIFLLLFLLPVIFTRASGIIVWSSVIKIWQDRILLVPLFALNHWFLMPKLLFKKKYTSYSLTVLSLITLITVTYYFCDQTKPEGIRPGRLEIEKLSPPKYEIFKSGRLDQEPQPVPPYADLLLFSLLIVAVDTGLSFSKEWHSAEQEKVRLEKENIEAQLGMLRNQISPHFFMNTLNNIYSLIDSDKELSKKAIMRLSKLMRYLLYENADGKILLSKEFEFLKSYVELMNIRYVNDIEISLRFPEFYEDVKVPVMLFISYLENAFKYGTSYQQKSFIEAQFEIEKDYLKFKCRNSKNAISENISEGGMGLKNSRQRLNLLYKDKYYLEVKEMEETFSVELKIPIQ